jgi:hypothetical protein
MKMNKFHLLFQLNPELFVYPALFTFSKRQVPDHGNGRRGPEARAYLQKVLFHHKACSV